MQQATQRNLLGFFGLVAVLVVAQPAPVRSQQNIYLPSSVTPKIPPQGLLKQAADSIGMVRGMFNDTFDAVNRVQFSWSGTEYHPQKSGVWTQSKIPAALTCISYHQEAMRVISDHIDDKGVDTHTVQVVAGSYAWTEESPGVGGSPAMDQAPRLARELWMTPQGFIYQAELASPNGVKISTQGGKTTISVVIHGDPVTATLDADHRPQRIEAKIHDPILGATTLSYEYSGYKDFDNYGIMYPSRIVAKLGGHTALDATVNSFETSPYFLFVKPDSVAKFAARK